jgi:hypothetical protein
MNLKHEGWRFGGARWGVAYRSWRANPASPPLAQWISLPREA